MPQRLDLASLETPVGRLWLAGADAGLVAIARANGPEPLFDELRRRGLDAAVAGGDGLAELIMQLAAYHAGERRELSVPLDVRGIGRFDAAVYATARRIPYGQTASYAEVAAMAGSPRAARAVGRAMARCPFFPVVPCHRVIHADGSLGGWGAEPWVKRWYLALERGAGSGTSAANA